MLINWQSFVYFQLLFNALPMQAQLPLQALGVISYERTRYTFLNHWPHNPSPVTESAAPQDEGGYFKYGKYNDKPPPKKVTLPEGSFCRSSFDGRAGYCMVANLCLHIIRLYHLHGSFIDLCSYRKSVPVICCPLAEKHVEEQRISATKCKEYNSAAEKLRLSDTESVLSGKKCVSTIPLIVGGTPTLQNIFPHMTALGWTQGSKDINFGCGGTLVSYLYVLTAAHCATSGSKPPDMVRLGAMELNVTSPWQQDIKIHTIILHPMYRSSSNYHDIALLKLTRRVQISEKVRPACLWLRPDLTIKFVIATGWGRTEFLGAKSNVLHEVDLEIIEQERCKQIYQKERRLPKGIIDSQFCAGNLEGGKDTCQGDSGGPLHAVLPEYNCLAFVVGITSFGKVCAAPNAAGVYTRLSSYLDWVERIVFKNE